MSDHWRSIRLGEVVTQRRTRVKVRDGFQYPLLGVRWYGEGPFLRETVSSETSKATSLYEVHAGDFIYNRLFAWKGSFGLIGEDLAGCFVSGEFPLFEVDEGRLDHQFLNFLMCRPIVWEQIEIESTGSTKTSRNRWKEEAFTSFSVRLPPLAEQRRIVDLVGSIDTYIESLETQIETTRTARSALLSELLSNPGDDWQETTLGDVADWFAGGTPKATNPAFYNEGQIPWAVIADLLNDPVIDTAKQINDEGLEAIGGRLAPVGSVLVSMYGTIARTAIAGVPLATNQAIAWAEPHEESCKGPFLRLLVDRLQPAFESAARGAAQKNINRGMIKDAGIHLPPLAEQRRIVDLVNSFDEQISSLDSQVESVRTLRSGVLSELLSGERLLDESYDVAVGL